MKQLYLFVLAAILALGTSFRAEAYTATFEWDEPGAVVFATSFANPFTNNGPETTSYVYNGTNSPFYVKAAEGYYLKSITRTSTDPEKAMICNTNATYGRYCMISFSTITSNINYPNDGATFKVEVEKIVYDGTITFNLVNASQFVTAKMGGTGRALTFKTGNNTINFAKGIETNISLEIAAGLFNWTGTNDEREAQFNQMVEDGNLYIKKNGEAVSGFSMFYGSLKLPSNIAIADGDVFEAKFTDMVDEVSDNATVTLKFADAGAKAAFGMAFNSTDGKRITVGADDTFEIEKGKEIRLSFSNEDYVITITQNGVEVPASSLVTNGTFTNYTTTIDDDTTITISSKERSYGTHSFDVYVNGLEGLNFFYGTPDGPVVDNADFQFIEEWSGYIEGYQRSYKKYRVSVSAKNPKIFFEAKEGYYIDPNSSFCAAGGKTDSQSLSDATIINVANVTYIDCKEIVADSKFVVYLNGETSSVKVKDGAGNTYTLTEGYNVFDFDSNYANGRNGFTVTPYVDENLDSDAAEAAIAKVYLNDSALAANDNNVYAGITVKDNDVLRIHNSVIPQHVITADVTDKNCTIIYDKVRKYEPTDTKTFTVYEGTEIQVTPAKDYTLSVDGDVLALEPGMAYPFDVTGSHTIAVKYSGMANMMFTTPDEGETVKEFNGILVEFPYADSVKFVGATDEITFSTPDERWAVPGIDPLKVEKVDATTFKISFKNTDLKLPGSGSYCYFIPEKAFEINGEEIYNADLEVTFNYEIAIETVPYVCAPWDPTPASDQDIAVTIGFCEYTMSPWGPDITVMYNISDFSMSKANQVKVTFNGNDVEYNASLPEDGNAYFQVAVEGCMFMVNTIGLKNKGGELVVTIPAGLFKVNGKPVPDVIATFEYTGGEEQVEITPDFSAPEGTFMEAVKDSEGNVTGYKVSDVSTISVVFEGHKTAEVFNEYGIRLKTKGSFAYSGVGSIVKRTDASKKAAARAAGEEGTTHIFDVTFPNAPTTNGEYELTIQPETFTVDSQAYPKEQILHNYTLDTSTGVLTITLENKVTVVSIDGKVLLKDADSSALSNLQPGLYIVNGKKTVVK